MDKLIRLKNGLNNFTEECKSEFKRTNYDNCYFGFLDCYFNSTFRNNIRRLLSKNEGGLSRPTKHFHYWAGSIVFSKKAIELIEGYQSKLNAANSIFEVLRESNQLIMDLAALAETEKVRLGIE